MSNACLDPRLYGIFFVQCESKLKQAYKYIVVDLFKMSVKKNSVMSIGRSKASFFQAVAWHIIIPILLTFLVSYNYVVHHTHMV